MEILSDGVTYKLLDSDPTKLIQQKLRSLLDVGVSLGVFTKDFSDKLFVEHPHFPLLFQDPQ